MVTKTIMIKTIIDGRELNEIAVKCDCDVDLKFGRYTVDAKSIMGIFSLNLLSKIELVIHTDDEEIVKLFDKFVVED